MTTATVEASRRRALERRSHRKEPRDHMDTLTHRELTHFIQFFHPEKTLSQFPGVNDDTIARMLGEEMAEYRGIKDSYATNARRAADELLADASFAASLRRLPFRPTDTVVGLGDSITDDYQSWFEILRYALKSQTGQDQPRLINAGVSGDTTTQMISRFLAVVPEQPDWVICLAGTNDARTHGRSPGKVLVSPEETARNLAELRRFARARTQARWAWITPPPVIEKQIAEDWFLSVLEVMVKNEDIAAVADLVRGQPEPVVDLHEAFGTPPDARLFLDDGLHPSLEGQKAIVKALVEGLT